MLGYQVGLRGNPSRVMAALLTLMWTVVIVDILDLASPGSARSAPAPLFMNGRYRDFRAACRSRRRRLRN